MNPITALLTALGALTAVFVGLWGRAIAVTDGETRGRGEPDPAIDARFPTPLQVGVGLSLIHI